MSTCDSELTLAYVSLNINHLHQLSFDDDTYNTFTQRCTENNVWIKIKGAHSITSNLCVDPSPDDDVCIWPVMIRPVYGPWVIKGHIKEDI